MQGVAYLGTEFFERIEKLQDRKRKEPTEADLVGLIKKALPEVLREVFNPLFEGQQRVLEGITEAIGYATKGNYPTLERGAYEVNGRVNVQPNNWGYEGIRFEKPIGPVYADVGSYGNAAEPYSMNPSLNNTPKPSERSYWDLNGSPQPDITNRDISKKGCC